MKKVLVTGAAGFIGSHLCEALVESGHSVKAFIHYNSRNFWGWLESSKYKNDLEIVTGDIRDFDSVSKNVEGVDQIYHLAALIGIPYSYESPAAYLKTNIEGTYNIVESARRANTQRVLITSTSEVYGTAQYVPIDEKHPLQPQSPYSASKIAADNFALSFYNSFETPITVARPFNTYGPRQSARAIIPTIISQLLAKVPEVKLGNLDPVRDLTFAQDTATGMIAIAKQDAFLGKAVNIGTNESISIGDLYETIAKIIGHRAEIVTDPNRVRPKNSEVMKLISNNELLRSHSNWKPKFSIQQGLEETVNWLKEHQHLYKPDIYNV